MPTLTKTELKGREEALTRILEIRRLLHDLNNVLTGVLISAGLLKHSVPLTPPGGRYASEVEASAERGAGLVKEVQEAVHGLQEEVLGWSGDSTKVCDVRPSLGTRSGED